MSANPKRPRGIGSLSDHPLFHFGSFVFAVVLFVLVAITAYFTEIGVMESRDWVLHTYYVRENLQDLQNDVTRVRMDAFAKALTGDPEQHGRFLRESDSTVTKLNKIEQLMQDNELERERVSQLKPLLSEQLAKLKEAEELLTPHVSDAERAAASKVLAGESQLDAIIAEMRGTEDALLVQRLAVWRELFQRNLLVMGCILLAVVLLLIYNFRLLMKEVSRTREAERMQRENADSFRALSARILEMQDSERRRIARELHDSVGQYLVGLKFNLRRLQDPGQDKTANRELIEETVDMADKAIGEVRTISHLLHPPLLDELGFAAATQWYAEGFGKRSGIEVQLHIGEIAERLSRDIELALFRVLQEALTNVHRHSNATRVKVDVTCEEGLVELIVRDNGKGISRETLSRFQGGLASGIGLAGMRERLDDLGGTLAVESNRDGTTLTATVPTGHCEEQSESRKDPAVVQQF